MPHVPSRMVLLGWPFLRQALEFWAVMASRVISQPIAALICEVTVLMSRISAVVHRSDNLTAGGMRVLDDIDFDLIDLGLASVVIGVGFQHHLGGPVPGLQQERAVVDQLAG